MAATRVRDVPKVSPTRRMRHARLAAVLLAPSLFGLSAFLLFPILVVMYAYLSRKEEADMLAQFGEEYRRYVERTPRFVPGRLRAPGAA